MNYGNGASLILNYLIIIDLQALKERHPMELNNVHPNEEINKKIRIISGAAKSLQISGKPHAM